MPPSATRTPHSALRIGTRGSALALAQTGMVAEALAAACPGLAYELVRITTSGDRRAEPLAAIGGKGLFTKELEDALLRGDVDLAVHSLKDLPTELAPGLAIGAIPPRAPANDALITADCGLRIADCQSAIFALPPGATVATSSPRRAAQLLLLRPDLRIVPIRGNLDTRLRKLREGQADALVLALAGLIRLGVIAARSMPDGLVGCAYLHTQPAIAHAQAPLERGGEKPEDAAPNPQGAAQPDAGCVCRYAHPTGSAGASPSHPLLNGFAVNALPFDIMLPAPGQGALAIEIRVENAPVAELVARISHPPTVASTTAERELLRALGGGCQLPLGAYAEVLGETLRLRAVLLTPDGGRPARADRTGPASDPAALARLVASDLQPASAHVGRSHGSR